MKLRHAVFACLVTIGSLAAVPAAEATSPPPDHGGWQTAQPAAPTNLENLNAHGYAFLVWNPVQNAVGYNVYRDDQYLKTVHTTYAFDLPPNGYGEYYVTAFAGTPSNRAFSTRSNTVRHLTAMPTCNPYC